LLGSREEMLRVKSIAYLVNRLPTNNRNLLKFVIKHLKKVSEHEEKSKMGVPNLSVVFGPTLFRSRDESPTKMLMDAPLLKGCVETLINHFEEIFSEVCKI
jgi:hypothetical protein